MDLNRHCLIEYNIFIPKNVINLYISYTKGRKLRNLNIDLGNSLFGSVKLTKNADLDKYNCSGYSRGFASRSEFSLPDCNMRKNVKDSDHEM